MQIHPFPFPIPTLRPTLLIGALVLLSLLLLGCQTADAPTSTALQRTEDGVRIQLADDTRLSIPKAHTQILKSQSIWQHVGDLAEGAVYRPLDQVLVVNSYNVAEGYLVIDESNVVAIYLPSREALVILKATPIKSTKLPKI